ncbi:MAG: sigma 54-interacting transcriptional regulator [Acidobacteriota bacterium]|nr:sigma 54-interacting transcriptional regulator [Acidobacteriota bacterium]
MTVSRDEFGTTSAPQKPKRIDGQVEPVPALTVISHAIPQRVGDRALLLGLDRGRRLLLSRKTPDFCAPGKVLGKPLNDPFVSREPIYLSAGSGGEVLLDTAASKTPITVFEKPVKQTVTLSSDEIDRGVAITLADRVVLLLHRALPHSKAPPPDHPLVGASDSILFLHEEIIRIADLATPVLLRGPTGSGKELAARAIHDYVAGKRPFISVNMGAVPPSLAASELFGAMKGSFTGADRPQPGYFRAAQGGTLFLDEIGETPPEVQALLLRALESGEISPLGSQQPVTIDTRLIAATDMDLEARMADDSFKAPLFHRLAGYEIHLPPLRDRLEDLGRLFFHFAALELTALGEAHLLRQDDPYADPWLPAALTQRLLAFSWPGNVRQLRNMVRQLVIGCRGKPSLHLVPKVAMMLTPTPEAPKPSPVGPSRRKPASIEAEEVIATMRRFRWDIKATADALGISRGALYTMIDKTEGLRKAADLSAAEINTCLNDNGGNLEAAADALEVSAPALRRRIRALET